MHALNTEETFDLVIHRVGNSAKHEGAYYSKTLTFYPPEMSEILYDFFKKPFKTEEYFHFFDKENLDDNVVYTAVKQIFGQPTHLVQQSVKIAEKLYSVSGNPKTSGGELFVVYFPDALVEGENASAIGLFKTETREKILKTQSNGDSYDLSIDSGISLAKIDKGCLIFNLEEEDGYVLCSIDKGKGEDFGIWADEFLGIKQREDEFFDTENTLSLCKSFVMDQMPEEFEISRVDQADLLNKSVAFFKEADTFELGDFTEKVLEHEELKESFNNFKNKFEEDYDIELNDHFDISKSAVKKNSRFFKSVIKLDKNFHIYVHGNRRMIEQGVDEEGKKFYKLYYDTED